MTARRDRISSGHISPWTLLAPVLLVLLAARAPAPGQEPARAEPLLRFGAIADCQYCDAPGGERQYRLSPEKLEACVEHFNGLDLDFVIHLGDFIDRDWKSFDVVSPIYDRLEVEKHHVLGNHDYSVADEHKAAVPARLGMPASYYEFGHDGLRFAVLDGNDVSFQASTEGSPERRRAETLHKSLGTDPPKWNGAIGLEQLAWLDGVLERADQAGERAFLFAHFPIHPENIHNLWNDEQVLRVVSAHPSFAAWINGHNHAGNYAERDGRHFLTLRGMVDTQETSYAVLHVFEDRLEVEGFGREESRVLALRAGSSER
jgi:calcineurin-like phosphoesterase family protein